MDQGLYEQIVEPTRNEQVAVGVTSVIVSEARNKVNPRKVICIRNISDNATKIITVNLGFNKATSNNGIVLKQYESFTDTSETGYECFQGMITAISAVAASNLSVFER